MRAVAKTAGNASPGESMSEDARSVYEMVIEAIPVVLGSGTKGVAMLTLSVKMLFYSKQS